MVRRTMAFAMIRYGAGKITDGATGLAAGTHYGMSEVEELVPSSYSATTQQTNQGISLQPGKYSLL